MKSLIDMVQRGLESENVGIVIGATFVVCLFLGAIVVLVGSLIAVSLHLL